jgi:3-oxoacyl-[acyl-carrier protein] reductase
MDSGLTDNVVLITGAAQGIGEAAARAFSAEGARVALHANTNIGAARALADALPSEAAAFQADVRDESAVDALFADVAGRFGRIDTVVANAGVWPPDATPLHEMALDRWNDVMAVNATGVFLCARAFLRHLADVPRDAASLVIVGSSAAVFGEAGHAEYAASKAAVVYGLTRTLKNEIVALAPRGRVNAVCPGWTRTPMVDDALADEAAYKRVMQTRPLQAVATPEDIANTIVFLASEKLAGHITGSIVTVSGGMEGRVLRGFD